MQSFAYSKPDSLQQALERLSQDPEHKILAGGMTLLPSMKLGLIAPTELIDLEALTELQYIRAEAETIAIGAMTRHYLVGTSPDVQTHIPALAHLARHIGDAQVRNRGTLGGSIANNDPAADYPAAALALGATIVTDRRHIAADDYFIGLFETALEADEIIRELRFPIPLASAYLKWPNPASKFALVGVYVSQFAQEVRVAITGAGMGVYRAKDLENALRQSFDVTALAGIEVDPALLMSDIHATAEYRASLIVTLCRRAVEQIIRG